MNEDIKNQAVELDDEEMDNISGGKAMINIINFKEHTSTSVACFGKNISLREFDNYLFNSNACKKYKAVDESLAKACTNCKNYTPWGSLSLDQTSNIQEMNDYYLQHGYDVGIHNI